MRYSGLKQIKSIELANWILFKYGPMSHLKLQKMAFYSEAYHLAYTDEPLTDGEFEAWVHGPVNREIYNHFKGQASLYGDVKCSNANAYKTFKKLVSIQQEILLDVNDTLNTWTALELETATHKEIPWQSARDGYRPEERCERVISKELMSEYYKAEING